LRRRRADDRLDEEIRAHLDLLAAEYERRGMTPEQARRAARRDFGGVEPMKEAYRDRRGIPIIETVAQDVRDTRCGRSRSIDGSAPWRCCH
jgi:putative ABC transport system permease protein